MTRQAKRGAAITTWEGDTDPGKCVFCFQREGAQTHTFTAWDDDAGKTAMNVVAHHDCLVSWVEAMGLELKLDLLYTWNDETKKSERVLRVGSA